MTKLNFTPEAREAAADDAGWITPASPFAWFAVDRGDFGRCDGGRALMSSLPGPRPALMPAGRPAVQKTGVGIWFQPEDLRGVATRGRRTSPQLGRKSVRRVG